MKLEKEPTIFELQRLEEELSNSKDPVKLKDPLSIYLKDIGQVKLLSREEEIELATMVMMARDSTDDKIIRLGREARDRLIVANLRLVVSVAKKFTYSNVSLMDLIQDGTMGLMRAVDGYQVDKGFKFSTYATWWIIQSISRSIANNSRTIRIPVHVYDTLSKILRFKRNYVDEHGMEPDIQTVSKIIGISIVTLKMINIYIEDTLSLDNPIGDGDSTLKDLTEDTNNPDPEEYNKIKELEEYVIEILQVLNEREQTIIKMKFGIESDEQTLEEIGKYFGISKQRVGQILSNAIEKLRKQMNTLNNK